MPWSASTGAGVPDAPTVNATATPVVVLTGPGFAPNTGAVAGAALTVTLTTCVATPALLLAVKVKVREPTSFVGGV